MYSRTRYSAHVPPDGSCLQLNLIKQCLEPCLTVWVGFRTVSKTFTKSQVTISVPVLSLWFCLHLHHPSDVNRSKMTDCSWIFLVFAYHPCWVIMLHQCRIGTLWQEMSSLSNMLSSKGNIHLKLIDTVLRRTRLQMQPLSQRSATRVGKSN